MAGDHHRRLVALNPLHQLDVAEKSLAAPTGRRIGRRRVMHPDPAPRPAGGSVAKLVLDALPDQRPVPPRTRRKECIADLQAVAVAGDAEVAHLTDPARNLLAFRT